MKKNFILFAGILIVLLFFGEIGARVFQYSVRNRTIEDSIFHPVYRDSFFFGPSFKPKSGGAWQAIPGMKINSFGFRGEEFSLSKPEGIFRIVIFGGSTSHSGSYPEKLQQLLNSDYSAKNKKIEIINAAVPTWNTTQSLIQLITRVVYLEPDMILIYHAINDVKMTDYHWLYNLPRVDYEKFSGSLTWNSMLYNFTRNRIRKAEEKLNYYMWQKQSVELNGDDPAAEKPHNPSIQVFSKNITNFNVLAKHHGIKVGLITMPLRYDPELSREENRFLAGFAYPDFSEQAETVDILNDVIREIAAKDNVLLIDAAKSHINGERESFVDLCHFSEQGAQMFAELIRDKLYSMQLMVEKK